MSQSLLSDELLQAYRERGYLVVPDLVPEGVCNRLVAIAQEQENARDGTYSPIPMPHRVHPEFLAMMRFPPIVKIMEQLVGGKASGIGGEFFYMRPGTPGFSCHQDNAYVQAPPEAFCSAWTSLCDVDANNGALCFYPGSHRLGFLPTRERQSSPVPGQNPGAQAQECILPAGFTALNMVVKKGTTVFFHSLLVHGSNINRSQRFRYSFLATYLKSGEPFRSGQRQLRSEVDLYSSS